MRDILPDLDRWTTEQQPIAVATVVQTWGSSPRQPGAKMGIAPDNKISGSVSGGCIEGAVYEVGMDVLNTHKPQLLHFGVADETAWEVGLACGGSIDVFVETLGPELFTAISSALHNEKPFAIATVVSGSESLLGQKVMIQDDGSTIGGVGGEFTAPALEAARAALANGQTGRQTVTVGDQSVDLFVEAHWPPPTLVIVGGVHIAVALAALAKPLGYKTILIDPRTAFGSDERFPHVDKLIKAWPDEGLAQVEITHSTAIAMLTHDPKLDDPALLIALPSKAFYVGALGSNKTQTKRRERLQEAGLTEAQIGRLYGPIGIPLGARTPEEIALTIIAEVVAVKNGVRPH
jgi:xanthine dehydrogenase accessory factor